MTPIARAELTGRAFPAWLGVAMVLTLFVVQAAKFAGGAPAAIVTLAPTVAARTVVLPPPKPDGRATNLHGSGTEPAYTWERCNQMTGGFADACYAALARDRAERDPDDGLDACNRIGERELRFECTADVAEGHALVDVARSQAICETIPKLKWRDQCVFGISNAWALKDPAFALANCENSGQWVPFCRHDVNGARAQVDVNGAIAYCAGLDPGLQASCWHGIGKYVGRINVGQALATCANVPTDHDFRGQCMHGVGWAAAEANGPDAAAICEPLGIERDSCLLGVAYHTKRFDRDRATRLCSEATDLSERDRCLDMVARP